MSWRRIENVIKYKLPNLSLKTRSKQRLGSLLPYIFQERWEPTQVKPLMRFLVLPKNDIVGCKELAITNAQAYNTVLLTNILFSCI